MSEINTEVVNEEVTGTEVLDTEENAGCTFSNMSTGEKVATVGVGSLAVVGAATLGKKLVTKWVPAGVKKVKGAFANAKVKRAEKKEAKRLAKEEKMESTDSTEE